MPPNLKRLILFCVERDDTYERQDVDSHLCPLIRASSKGLVHLEFGASHICSEIFFDKLEIDSMRKNGICTGRGTQSGDSRDTDTLDRLAVQQTIRECRQSKRTKYRNERIAEATKHVKTLGASAARSRSLFGGGSSPAAAVTKAQRDMEASLDEEEEQRKRSILESNMKWFRRYISRYGSCDPNQAWAEMRIGADMEEEGIDLVLISQAFVS